MELFGGANLISPPMGDEIAAPVGLRRQTQGVLQPGRGTHI